jgi:hypothetical protein
MSTAEKAFITEGMFIDWPQNVFTPKADHLREMTKYEGNVVLIVGRHATHVTHRLIACAGRRKLSLIQLGPHSLQIA